MKTAIKTVILTVMLAMVFAPAAQAHKVTIFAWVEGGKVFTHSKFSGGKEVKGGRVAVYAPDGKLLLEGHTNDSGEFSFTPPAITDLKIVLTAGMGHQNSWTLSAAELSGQPPVEESAPAPSPSASPPTGVAAGLTAGQVEAIVARQLDEKLAPLTRMIAESREKGPSLSDIFGGIGYILGLVGLGAYVRYRRDRQQP